MTGLVDMLFTIQPLTSDLWPVSHGATVTSPRPNMSLPAACRLEHSFPSTIEHNSGMEQWNTPGSSIDSHTDRNHCQGKSGTETTGLPPKGNPIPYLVHYF